MPIFGSIGDELAVPITRPRPSVVNPVVGEEGEVGAGGAILFEFLRGAGAGAGAEESGVATDAGGGERPIAGIGGGDRTPVLLQTTRPRPSVRKGGSGAS